MASTCGDVAATLLASTSAAVVLVRADGAVEGVNPAAAGLLGVTADALVGEDAAPLLARPREVAELRQALSQVRRSTAPRVHETRLPGDAGSPGRSLIWALSLLTVAPPLVALIGIDISSTRSELDALQNQALTDELTGLANRAQLIRSLRTLAGTGATVMFCDLNGFKAVNDTYGHAAGDEVLVEVARRFVRALRGEDLVARLGGDEFVIVAPADARSNPEGLRRRVLSAVRQPMLLSGGLVVLVGVAVGTARLDPGLDPQTVLEQADRTMYAAKPTRKSSAALVHPAR